MKKGDTSLNVLILSIFGILIAILLIFSSKAYSEGLLGILLGEKQENINTEGMFANLIHQASNLGVGEYNSFIFGFNSGWMIIAFPKNVNVLKSACFYKVSGLKGLDFGDGILKTNNDDCRGKSCLCLCEVKELKQDEICNKPGKFLCQGFELEVKDDLNYCGVFGMQDGKVRNIYMKREKDALYINLVKGGKGSEQAA